MQRKKRISIFPMVVIGALMLFSNSCKKTADTGNLLPAETVTDIDGNVYHAVTVGTQVWMVENLKTTKYNDGSSIPDVTNDTAWFGLTNGACCDYNNTLGNFTSYGKLYNYYAVVDARKICPTGWHVPTDAEWTTLTTYLGGELLAGGKLKESGLTHWFSPNTGAENSVGFIALPGGYRRNLGSFDNMGYSGIWWSSSEESTITAWDRDMTNSDSQIYRASNFKSMGLSLRCIRD